MPASAWLAPPQPMPRAHRPNVGQCHVPIALEMSYQLTRKQDGNSAPRARIACKLALGRLSGRRPTLRQRFRIKRLVFFIQTRRFRLAANVVADSCAHFVICSWGRSMSARRASSGGAAPNRGRRPAAPSGDIEMCSMIPLRPPSVGVGFSFGPPL